MPDKFPKTKVQILRALSEKADLPQTKIAQVLDALAELAYDGACNGGFPIPGIGKLTRVDRAARTGFNPRTQEKIQIPAKRRSVFGAAGRRAEVLQRFFKKKSSSLSQGMAPLAPPS